MTYDTYAASRESPDGRDNAAGSGAFGRFQFMPATALELAQKTPWGAGLTPDTIKAAVMGVPGRDKELFDLYNAGSQGALKNAGIPATNPNMLALHRFGQGGGTSLLQAPANMPVAQWVKSVNWGPGVAADAVIRQNGLDRYSNVGDLRRGFIGTGEQAPPLAEAFAGAPAPAAPEPASFVGPTPTNPMLAASLLADAFTMPDPEADRRRKKRSRPLFG